MKTKISYLALLNAWVKVVEKKKKHINEEASNPTFEIQIISVDKLISISIYYLSIYLSSLESLTSILL